MFKNIFVGMLALLILIGCSNATSEPQYKFRKANTSGVAVKAGTIIIEQNELLEPIELDIYKKELEIFEIKFNRAKSLLLEKLVKADPKSKGLTNDQYFDKYIANKIKISDKEIQDFVKKNNVPADKLNQQIKTKIEEYIRAEKKKDALSEYIAEKTNGKAIEIFISKPIPPTYDVEVGSAPFAGGSDAKVTVVEFSDFQCPFCAKAAQTVKQIKEKYGKKVKFVFKQFPLSFHGQAKKAAVASLCANEQGSESFWKLHDELFSNQANLAPDKIKETAKKLGLDSSKFNTCLDENKFIGAVEKDIIQGRKLGVKGTPTFFVNGMIFLDGHDFDKFSEFIDQELAR